MTANCKWHTANDTYGFSKGLGVFLVTMAPLVAFHNVVPLPSMIGSLLIVIMSLGTFFPYHHHRELGAAPWRCVIGLSIPVGEGSPGRKRLSDSGRSLNYYERIGPTLQEPPENDKQTITNSTKITMKTTAEIKTIAVPIKEQVLFDQIHNAWAKFPTYTPPSAIRPLP